MFPSSLFDNLKKYFKNFFQNANLCPRELPGYELRQIMDKHKSDEVTLEQFAKMFQENKKADFANTFKTSIKEATGVINKKNNAVEVEKVTFFEN